MTKVHANNDNDILVFETHMPQDTKEQNICGLSIEKRNPNSTQKPLEIDHEHRFAKENTTNSDNEEQEGPCNKFETEENQTNKKATSNWASIRASISGINNLNGNQSPHAIEEEEVVHAALQLEKELHEWRRNVRIQLFKKLLSNGLIELDWPKCIFYIIATIFICAAAPFPFTLIAAHNLILFPGYWYEYTLQSLIWPIGFGIWFPYWTAHYMNIDLGYRCYLASVVVGTGVFYLVFFFYFFIWTHVLHLPFPMPFHNYLCAFSTLFACIVVIYFGFPQDWRMDRKFRRRLKFWIYDCMYSSFVVIQYDIAAKILHNYQNDYQPAAALILILIRELHAWIKRKYICEMASGDEPGANVAGMISVATKYTMHMCYILGTSSTLPTEIFLVGFDFIFNIYTCLRLVWLHKRRPEDVEEQIDLIQELALNELMEFISPLSFIIAFILAYTGPNAKLIGNISITIWHYEAIEDAPEFLKVILILFFVDFCSTIISTILLWVFCKINFITVLLATQKEHGRRICVFLVAQLLSVRDYFRIKIYQSSTLYC